MTFVESLTDADIAEVRASAGAYHDVKEKTSRLRRFLDFWQAVKWLDLSPEEGKAPRALFDGQFGQPLPIAAGITPPNPPAGWQEGEGLFGNDAPQQLALNGTGVASAQDYLELKNLLVRARALAAEQRFLHWQTAFPGVWTSWTSAEPQGGFDAVIGNPPWDRLKMQEVEWFAARAPQVARQARAADRKLMIAELKVFSIAKMLLAVGGAAMPEQELMAKSGLSQESFRRALLAGCEKGIFQINEERPEAAVNLTEMGSTLVAQATHWPQSEDAGAPLIALYEHAARIAEKAMERARKCGDYPLLSKGDINIYALFVERAQAIIKPDGIAVLLTPPGIAFDLTASKFFKRIIESSRLHTLYVFENERQWLFAGVHAEKRPTITIISGDRRRAQSISVWFNVTALTELSDPDRHFEMSPSAMSTCNPNTNTAVIFRRRRDADLLVSIYQNNSIMVSKVIRHRGSVIIAHSAHTLHLTTDSSKFWTRERLEAANTYCGPLMIWQMGEQKLIPLLEGKAIEQFNHRYAHVEFSKTNISGQGNEVPASLDELSDPNFRPIPRYWVKDEDMRPFPNHGWSTVFRDTANITAVPNLGMKEVVTY
jgi:hypothetical protein